MEENERLYRLEDIVGELITTTRGTLLYIETLFDDERWVVQFGSYRDGKLETMASLNLSTMGFANTTLSFACVDEIALIRKPTEHEASLFNMRYDNANAQRP